MDDLPEHYLTRIPLEALVNLEAIARLPDAPGYAALRSYATGRRTNRLLGPMPEPVCRLQNMRLWLRTDVELWLHVPIEPWARSRRRIRAWIEAGRPRGATVPADDAPRTS